MTLAVAGRGALRRDPRRSSRCYLTLDHRQRAAGAVRPGCRPGRRSRFSRSPLGALCPRALLRTWERGGGSSGAPAEVPLPPAQPSSAPAPAAGPSGIWGARAVSGAARASAGLVPRLPLPLRPPAARFHLK